MQLLFILTILAGASAYLHQKEVFLNCPLPTQCYELKPGCKSIIQTYPFGNNCPPCSVCVDRCLEDIQANQEVNPVIRELQKEPLVACTLLPCLFPRPTEECRHVYTYHPNGEQCDSCDVCVDRCLHPDLLHNPKTVPCMGEDCNAEGIPVFNQEHEAPDNSYKQHCPKIGCPLSSPGEGCEKVVTTYPYGKECQPCHVCVDRETEPCNLLPCQGPIAGSDCQNKQLTYPNGLECEECRICLDDMRSEKPCTKLPCTEPRPDETCTNVEIEYPNGKGCAPACPVCKDDVNTRDLLLPEISNLQEAVCTYKGCGFAPEMLMNSEQLCDGLTIEYFPNGRKCPPCIICLGQIKY